MERMIIFTTPIFKIFVLIQNPFQINKTIRFLTRNRNQFVIELKQFFLLQNAHHQLVILSQLPYNDSN
jgi:hypothetical protein